MSIDMEAIKGRADAATEGPWELTPSGAMLGPSRTVHGLAQWVVQLTDLIYDADAEFIAAARTDVPALVDEVVRLRAIVETVRAETLIEAADEVHREARWQYERQLRTVRPVSLDPIPRLTMIERILRERAAALSPSTPLVEPSGVGE